MVFVEVVMEEEKRKSMMPNSDLFDVIPYSSYSYDDDDGFRFCSDYNSTTFEDLMMNVITEPELSQPVPSPAPEYSSSISSSSADHQPTTGNYHLLKKTQQSDDDDDDNDDGENQEKTTEKLSTTTTTTTLKPKKKKQKKEREARFAFMTKSDVDHLDDGFRWRKYGQKAVKNSPFPRSYYRCTSTGCGVKKRVERCREEPGIVVTTYEGTHKHPCPMTLPARPTFFGFLNNIPPPHHHHQMLLHQQQQQPAAPYDVHHHNNNNNFSTFSTTPTFNSQPSSLIQERPFRPSVPARDHGLLQDMLMMRETTTHVKEE